MENYSAVRRVESRRALARWKRDRQNLDEESFITANVGGGNASDVAYGYPFMRQGAAVPGTWKDDPTGSGTYGDGVTTKQADKDKLAAAFDPTDDNQYDFSKSAAQDWWIERGATGDNPDITDVEAFANSAPWFLTNSGYATGGTNSGKTDQTFVIDLSKYGEIADGASGDLYLTTETSRADKDAGVDSATPEVFAKTSNVKQDAGSVVIDKADKTATVTVPARSIASIQLKGVTGIAEDAGVQSGHTYQLVGVQSGKNLSATASGDSTLSIADTPETLTDAKKQAWKFTQIDQSDTERPDLKAYVITNTDCKVRRTRSSVS